MLAAFLLQSPNTSASIPLPNGVETLLEPILDLRAQAESSAGEKRQAAFEKSEKLVAGLFQVKTKNSDEALVVLMNFYVGESLQADLVHEVTLRGKRMLPLLLKYRKESVTFTDRKYTQSMLLADDIRQRDFDNAIDSVKRGRVFKVD
jgi:hypothetical protein